MVVVPPETILSAAHPSILVRPLPTGVSSSTTPFKVSDFLSCADVAAATIWRWSETWSAGDANLSGILGAVIVGALCCTTAGAPWTFEWKAFFLVPSMSVNDSFNIPYWTLIYEICFYCFVYWLIMIRATRDQVNLIALSWVLAIVVYFYRFGYFSHVLPGAWICFSTMNLLFIVGFLCGVNEIKLPAGLPRPFLWFLAIVLWTTGDAFAFPEKHLVTLFLQAGAAGLVVLLMAQQTMRVPRVLVSLGAASYGIYLIHFIIIAQLVRSAGYFGFSGPYWLAVTILFTATLPIAVGFGLVECALHERWASRLQEFKQAPTVLRLFVRSSPELVS